MSDLRSFLALLREEYPEDVVVIQDPVEPDFEITAIVNELERKTNPVVLFSKVKGFEFPIVTNILGTRKRMALATGASVEDLYETWNKKIQNLIKPRLVPTGPVKERKFTGDQVDVTRLPIHQYFQQDGGKYIANALMVVKDPESGVRNLSFSRTQLVDRVTLRNSMSQSA